MHEDDERADEDAETTQAAERELDALVAASDERGVDTRPADPPPATTGGRVGELFAGIRVERTEEGGMRLEASPESAGELAAVLEGLAGLLRSAAK